MNPVLFKPLTVFIMMFVAVAATVLIEEYRIKSLQDEIKRLRKIPEVDFQDDSPQPDIVDLSNRPIQDATGNEPGADAVLPEPTPTPPSPEPSPDDSADAANDESAENEPVEQAPAPQPDTPTPSLRNVPDDFPAPDEESVKALAVSAYSDLFYQLGLNNRERAYFDQLLNERMLKRQELAMKWMGAAADQRAEIEQEMSQAKEAFLKKLSDFLKRESAVEAFVEYDNKQPARQMIMQQRAIMDQLGVTLDAEKENRVIEVMHAAAQRNGSTQWESVEGLKKMAAGDALEDFDKEWAAETKMLEEEVAEFLSAEETKAFLESREQIGQSLRASLKAGMDEMGAE